MKFYLEEKIYLSLISSNLIYNNFLTSDKFKFQAEVKKSRFKFNYFY